MNLWKDQMSESFRVGALLAFAGGFFDSYTYIARGGVFANAQTGNMILLAIQLVQGQFYHALYYLIPIFAFVGGIFLMNILSGIFLKKTVFTGGKLYCSLKSSFWLLLHLSRLGKVTF